MSWIVLEDNNLVMCAFNLDHVSLITLTDAGRATLQPIVSIGMADGTVFPHLQIPVPDEVRNPANVNESWKHHLISLAIAEFFERLRDVIP